MSGKLRSIIVVCGMIFTCSVVTNAAIRKGPYLLYPGDNTQMTVLWQLDSTEGCTLEWGTDTSYSDGSTGTSEYDNDHQHKYTITDLIVNTKYYYRVTVGVSQYTGSFRSAPSANAEAVKFLAYGDTRTYTADHAVVCGAMINTFANDPDYQTFTLHVGDWVNNGATEFDWANEFFNRSHPNLLDFQANLPINGCIGNHEWRGDLTPPTYYGKYWPYPYIDGFYWSFDYGPVHIAVIDQYSRSYSTGSTQHDWLINDLANSTKEWKVILFHEPGYSASRNNLSVQNYIQPLCETYGADLVFAGHNHYYARCDKNGVKHITTGGGGAPLYEPDPGYPYLEVCSKNYHYCKIDIIGEQLDLEVVKPDGTVIDSFMLSHLPHAAIDSPEDGSTVYYGEPVTFTGSASYGSPPYTYEQESDVDGYLGSGSSIVVSDLNVYKVGDTVQPHTITLTVEDDNSGVDTAQTELTVLFKGDFEPDGNVDLNDYATLASNWYVEFTEPTPTAGWWKFDESSGFSAADSTGNGNTGALCNMSDSGWVTGKYGNALDFDGSNDYVRISDSDSISVGNDDFSLSAWIYPHTVIGKHAIITKVNGSQEKEYLLSVDNGGYIRFEIERSSNNGMARTTDAVVTTNSWQRIMATYNASTYEVLLYHNDQLQTITSTIEGPSNILSDYLCIGMLGGPYLSDHFDGLIDDVKIYDYIIDARPIIVGDLNEDDVVDFKDLAELIENWLKIGIQEKTAGCPSKS